MALQACNLRLSTSRVTIIGLLFLTLSGESEVLPESATHQYATEIIGVSEDHARQIRAHLAPMGLQQFDNMSERVQELEQRAKLSLQALGYYQPTLQTKHATYKGHTSIQLFVDIGNPVVIEELTINVIGEARDNREFNRVLARLPVRRGQILHHGNYEKVKDLLYSQARRLGFFNARFDRSQVLVESKAYQAKIWIDFNSGKRHSISRIEYDTDLFKPAFLAKWQSFEAGIPYRASHAAKLTRNLQNSGYFKHVSVKPDLSNTVDHQVPLKVDLVPSSENTVGFGVGYATDTDLRLKGSWLRPHHNLSGHALQGSMSVSRRRQELSLSYRIPHQHRPEHGRFSIEAGLLNHTINDTFSQLRTINFTDARLVSNGWYRDLFVRIENENTEDGTQRTNMLLPGFSFSRTKSDSGIRPERGNFFSLSILGGSKRLFSEVNMLRATATAKKLFSWNHKNTVITRADIGFVKTSDFEQLAPSHRFFTGGDNSVRGFEYQSITPLNNSDNSEGGRYLSNFSIEYNRYFKDRWAIAAFADTGRAFNNNTEPYRVGVGAGLRWLSPVGPLRIDVAVGVSEEDKPVRMHLAIGPQL